MRIQEFLLQLESGTLPKNSLINFIAPFYPILFFSFLRRYLSSKVGKQLQSVDCSVVQIEQFTAELSIAFLSHTQCYWAGNISALDAKTKKKFLTVFKDYHGPHQLWFYTEQLENDIKKNKDCLVVELPLDITPEMVKKFSNLFLPPRKTNDAIIDLLFARTGGNLSLDNACLLLHYVTLLSRPLLKEFMNEWLDVLLVPEKSLFTLSTLFFSKKADSFFELWHDLQHEYPPQFWISYWSEQIFRATYFVKYARANKFLEAKNIAYRLPFTLIKKDWKNLTSKELAQAHHLLYDIYYRLKNGGTSYSLDFFYAKFFNNF